VRHPEEIVVSAFRPAARPEVPPAGEWTFPAAGSHAGPGGLTIVTVPMPGQYLASARLVVATPLAAEPDGQDGIATIVARTMDEGTKKRSAQQFQADMEALGAQYGAWSQEAGVQVSVDAPAGRLVDALALMAEAVTSPAFDADEVNRHVQLRLADIAVEAADPATVAAEVTSRRLFTPDTRISRPTGGSVPTISVLTSESVRRYYESAFAPERSTLIVTGALSEDDILRAVDAAFGPWIGSADAITQAPEPTPARTPGLVLVDRPGAVQTELVIGAPAVDRTDPHWAAHVVAARVMGGTITSRLDAELRERKGYTYGMRAGFNAFSRGGQFVASGAVRTEVSGAALRDAMRILTDVGDGFRDDEIHDAADFLVRAAPLRYETSAEVAHQLAVNVANRAGLDFVDRHHRAILAVTPAEAGEAWSGTLPITGYTAVLAGDATAIETQLAALDFTPFGWSEQPMIWQG
jgi:zinc protease